MCGSLDEHIFRFDVPVHDAVGVHVAQRHQQTRHEPARTGASEAASLWKTVEMMWVTAVRPGRHQRGRVNDLLLVRGGFAQRMKRAVLAGHALRYRPALDIIHDHVHLNEHERGSRQAKLSTAGSNGDSYFSLCRVF
jgi:hypothetical protein